MKEDWRIVMWVAINNTCTVVVTGLLVGFLWIISNGDWTSLFGLVLLVNSFIDVRDTRGSKK